MTDTRREPSANASRRKNFLYLVLAMMIGMLGYDYRVARPSVDRAYQKIAQRNVEVNDSPERSLTNEDVQALITKTPSRTFSDGRDLVEVYSWRSGLPIRTHDLFAVYKESIRGEQVFYRQAKFVYETSADVAPIAVQTVVEATPEQIAAHNHAMAEEFMLESGEAKREVELPEQDGAVEEARAK